MKKLYDTLRIPLIIICIAIIAFSSYKLYESYSEYKKGKQVYENLSEKITMPEKPVPIEEPEPQTEPEKEIIVIDPMKTINFEELFKINKEVVGWIYTDNAKIDYPIVQRDDNEYYLDHLLNGEYGKVGTIFMDYRSSAKFEGKNAVIYGHNMKDGSMFMSINGYKEQSYYDSHPTLEYYTPDKNYRLEVFSGFIISADERNIKFDFKDDAEFLEYIAQLKEKSDFKTDVEFTKDDKILTLVTCTYEFDDARYTVYAKLVPMN